MAFSGMKHLALQALFLVSLLIPFAVLVVDFGDRAYMLALRNSNIMPAQTALELIFDPPGGGEVDGLFQQAMNAQPIIYAALLFTVFDEEFRLRAFAGEGNEGQGNGLCVLLKNQGLLPRVLSHFVQLPGTSQATMPFPDLKAVWLDFRRNRDDFLPPGVVIPQAVAPEQMVPVPLVLRPLIPAMLDAHGQVLQQDLLERFLLVYAGPYPVGNRHDWHNAFKPALMIGRARRGHLRTLFWMLVGQPFQEVVAQNAHLFRGIDPDWLIPGGNDPQAFLRNFKEDSEDEDYDDGGGGPAAPAARGGGRGPGGGGRGRGGNVPALQAHHLPSTDDEEDDVAPYMDPPLPPFPPLSPSPPRPVPPVVPLFNPHPLQPAPLPSRVGTSPSTAAPAATSSSSSGSCSTGPTGTVSTGGAGSSSTSQATCSATSSHSSAPGVAACAAEKLKQEGGNSPHDDGPRPAKQHKPDEPPKGSGGGGTGMAN